MSSYRDEGWLKPDAEKEDAAEIKISSHRKDTVIIPGQIEKKIGALSYTEGETFQIGKNGKAIINRTVPTGKQFTVYVRIVIEKEKTVME